VSLPPLVQTTEIEKPFLYYHPDTGTAGEEMDGQGIVVCGVDILPSELPREVRSKES
jgi:hypothetical protein